ncbi:site-specific integrase [Oxalicibacterium faecigallinarum]|nr:site-specific integrase [Oxalicibacterium faecigallinarum]
MASIDSRYPGKFRVRISLPDLPRLTKTFSSRKEAEDWASYQENLIIKIQKAIERKLRLAELAKCAPAVTTSADFKVPYLTDLAYETPTLHEALGRYLSEVTPHKKGAVSERSYIRRWQRHPLAAFPLLAIRGHHLALHRDNRLRDGISGSTLQKEFALISHVFKVARTDWGYEDLVSPTSMFRKPKIARGRDRRFRGDEESRLLSYCESVGDARLKNIIILATETAMRRGEIMRLTHGDVDINARIVYLRDTKNGEPREVPLSTRAVAALESIPRTSKTKIVDRNADVVTTDFKAACKACGIENFRFHDLRHEATTRLFEKGFKEMEVAAITGHKTLNMLKRYTHLKVADFLARLG